METDEAAEGVHLLKTGGDEADDSGGDLGGGEVLTDSFASARGRIEEGEIVGHSGPHACDDDAEEQAQEAVEW